MRYPEGFFSADSDSYRGSYSPDSDNYTNSYFQ